MTYVIKFLNVRGKYSTYPPNKGRILGMNSEAFEKGFIRAEKNKNPIKIKNKDGFISKALITVRNILTVAKLIPPTEKLSSNYGNNCFVTGTNQILNIRASRPKNDIYKLELMCQKVGGDNSYNSMLSDRMHKASKFLYRIP